MKIRTLVLGAMVSAAALVATAEAASARVVCNSYGDCWRTHENYNYQPSYGLKVYDDNWKWDRRDDRRYRWRDYHRGYYGRNGVWITF